MKSKHVLQLAASLVAAACGLLALAPAHAQEPTPSKPATSAHATKGTIKMNTVSGTFEVKLAPQPMHDAIQPVTLARMSIDKTFKGPLDATSKGEMLSAMSGVKGSAGYVALERVTGTLEGRKGSFVLQHSGTMTRGAPTLSVTVVPDSGTDELAGLSGKMNIIIADGKHSYEFSYSINP